MSRPPSDRTLLLQCRYELRRTVELLKESDKSLKVYRERAMRAEQDAAEWKARFDMLLRRGSQGESK